MKVITSTVNAFLRYTCHVNIYNLRYTHYTHTLHTQYAVYDNNSATHKLYTHAIHSL